MHAVSQGALSESPRFSKLRSFFWPIYQHELKKLLPMFFLFFLISFIFNTLRCMKISVILTAEGSGAEAIPFLKFCVVLPASFLMVYLFAKLSNRYDREKVIYIILSLFLSFFALFAFFLFPNRELFELNRLAEWLTNHPFVPSGFSGLIAVIRHWILAVFYVLSDMWSTIVLSILFWGFANEVTKVNEAKRFYAIFALGANSSGIFSGQIAQILKIKNVQPFLPFQTAWDQTFFLQISIVLVLGLIIMGLFWWLNHAVIPKNTLEYEQTLSQGISKLKRKKPKLSLKECFAYLVQSRYMRYILMLVIGYNIVYNLADVMWSDRMEHEFADPVMLNAYMNNVTSLTGAIAVIFAFVISGNAIRIFGWFPTAMITPVIWCVTSIGFFLCLFVEGSALGDALSVLLGNPVNLALLFSSIQMSFGRAGKYTVFDETKEIAFIPLSKEEQRKGKAVVDGIASRVGKSGGAIIYIVLLTFFGTVQAAIPYLGVIMFLMMGLWIVSVYRLGLMVNETIDQEKTTAEIQSQSEKPIPTASEPDTVLV